MLKGDPSAIAKLKLTNEDLKSLGKGKFSQMSPTKKKMNKNELNNAIEELKAKNGGKINKAELMALLMKSDLTPDEMKELAKKHGIKLTKDDLKLMAKMKKQNERQQKQQ